MLRTIFQTARLQLENSLSRLASKQSRLSIRVKLTIALLICAVFTPLVLVAYTALLQEETLLEKQVREIRYRLDMESQLAKSLLDSTSRDVVFLSQVPAVRIFSSTDFLASRKANEKRMLDHFSKVSSTEVFADFMRTNPLYRQLTYIDSSGMERLSIDQQLGQINLIAEGLLEDQSHRGYFSHTMSLSENEVYISNVELYSGYGSSNSAAEPIIRLATQVYDKRGSPQGILVINVSGQIMLNIVQKQMPMNGLVFLIDPEGYYLAHHNIKKSWSKLRGNHFTLQSDFAGLDDLPAMLSDGGFHHIVAGGNEIFVSPISTEFDNRRRWYIVRIIPSSSFVDSARSYLFVILLITILGILFSLVIGYTFSKVWLLAPIKKLTELTGEISKGRYTTMCPDHHQKDEIGNLCSSFNQMSMALEQADQERKEHLDVLNKEIAERKKAESDLLLHRTFFEQSTDAMFIADKNTRFTYVNPAFSEITGYASDEVIGSDTGLLQSKKHDANFYRSIWREIKRHGYWHGEIWERRKGEENFPALQTINTIRNENGETHYVSVFKDITRLKETENELWKLAHFDQLTNLANRKLLEERINQAISEAYRNKRVGSLIFLDLDNFKHINDSLGHNDGDLMLREIATRLKAVFRCEDTVARLGGDEYVVLVPDLANDVDGATHVTTTVIQKLFDTLQEPFSVKRYELHITTSIGIALFPSDGDTPQKLLRQADTAMYIAKNEGKNTFSFYHSGMQEMADQRLHMEREIRRALKTDEMMVYYQPQYNARYQLIGYEALIRWIHPEQGPISPNDFIPVAEESDLILEIGDKVMRDVCEQLIRAAECGSDIPQVSVNISSRQFAHLKFVDWVYSILDETGVDPNKLVLEITEGMIIRNLDRTISNMQMLKTSGIRFSVDDFGTGYSSLAYLKQLPIDELKIDRSFVCDFENEQNAAAIVDTIVAMARHLKLEVIAEGVEKKEQLDWLIECGCNGFQGYYFGAPVPSESLHLRSDVAQICE